MGLWEGLGIPMTKMGMKRDPDQKRKPIRKLSQKQAKRTVALHCTFRKVLEVQKEIYGRVGCQAGFVGWSKYACSGKLVPDHVFTRNEKDADGAWNIQPLCTQCNYLKGSQRIDFRPIEMSERLKELD